MSIDIEILQNGRPIQTMSLEKGTYKIGRSPSSDLFLADNAVSKNHATLIIDNDSIYVRDNGSVNGVYFKGEKIAEKKFKKAFQIEIKPFTLRTRPQPESIKSLKEISRSKVASSLILGNIKISVFLLVAFTIFISFLIIYIPLKNRVKDIHRDELLKNGILLSRYLAEMNRPFLERGEHSFIRTSPLKVEDGVLYAFIVDGHGRIIAPHEQQGDFYNWSELPKAFSEGELRIGRGPENERIIFTPILQHGQVLGAGIIGFTTEESVLNQKSGLGAGIIFLLVILFGVSMALSYLLVKAFFSPLNTLYEEVEISIKEGRNRVDYNAPYEELNNLSRAFNRLLLRKESNAHLSETVTKKPFSESQQPPEGISSQGEIELSQSRQLSPAKIYEQIKAIDSPWCIINGDDYTVVEFSENFIRDLELNECRSGMHIIEAFNGGIIQAVSQILDDPDIEFLEIEIAGKNYSVRGLNNSTDKSKTVIIFEEKG